MNKLEIPRVAIVMAGGGAAGKSTTSKTFAIGEPREFSEKAQVMCRTGLEEKKVKWTLYDNCGLSGGHHSGTDANNGPGAVKHAAYKCLEKRSIAIVDGMVSSPQWVTMLNEWPGPNLDVVVVHFDLSAEELLTRLARRRQVEKESIRDEMYDRCVGLVRRANKLVGFFEELSTRPVTKVIVSEMMSPEAIVAELDDTLEMLYDLRGIKVT